MGNCLCSQNGKDDDLHNVLEPNVDKSQPKQESIAYQTQVTATTSDQPVSVRPFEISRDRTLRQLKRHKKGTLRCTLHNKIKTSLSSSLSDLKEIVKCPSSDGMGCSDQRMLFEWYALHVIDFFNEISLLYGTISDLCTETSCPKMSAGVKYTYLWGQKNQRPVPLPAKQYVDNLMEWIEGEIAEFPIDESAFPEDFESRVSLIFRRLFRVYAHLYHSHFKLFLELRAEAHLNTCFKRFVFFVKHFSLVDERELGPMAPLIKKIEEKQLLKEQKQSEEKNSLSST
eukprot:TRINITY_DN778148_c0_g1_i1.p1 TRINITY_DN778148_c0_g1~~TRINITY_DN778148_c0_g1_i1.p1  ORF type:complete len:285 (-),score=49.51 TRINITY_DN778148_c0_g1_i1:246-1100(-)